MAWASTVTATNDTTDVTIVANPAAATNRIIPANGGITVYNADTVDATVTLQLENGTDNIIEKFTLSTGETYKNDWVLILDGDATDTVQIYLAGAVTTNQLEVFTHWRDEAQ